MSLVAPEALDEVVQEGDDHVEPARAKLALVPEGWGSAESIGLGLGSMRWCHLVIFVLLYFFFFWYKCFPIKAEKDIFKSFHTCPSSSRRWGDGRLLYVPS